MMPRRYSIAVLIAGAIIAGSAAKAQTPTQTNTTGSAGCAAITQAAATGAANRITEQNLVTESYQKRLQNSPANLMPSFDFEGTEEDWEQQQLIEAVRARRRATKT